MSYVDLNTIHNPATGTVAPAAWGDQVRDNLEFLIDPPACSVFHSANQLIPDSTVTALNANSETFDNDAMHSTVSDTSRITIQTPGRYLFLARASFAANASGARELRVRVDGTTLVNGLLLPTAGASATWRASFTAMLVLSAGQYVETVVNQNSGGDLNAALVEFACTFLTR